jgi:hypothetical protein
MALGTQRDACAHCGTPIVNPTTQVVHGAQTFCCANCSAAMEVSGSGSDPKTMRHGEDDLSCAHCGVAIVHEATMESRGDDAYCCANCAAMADRMAAQRSGTGG